MILWPLILVPIIIGYIPQIFCRLKENTGDTVKFRPPGLVFAIVWPILYLLLGVSWFLAGHNTEYFWLTMILYSLFTVTLALWPIVYNCMGSKKGATWLLVINLAIVLACFRQGNRISQVLLTPMIAWLIFALDMNNQDIQQN